ncbi:Golgi membrane protein 1-like isoform X5 [Frieseomelitta varia]|uniref:Golgi membrane protein 1-like isoform X5 n=1 Tax=Frieseomelitta varia TaxID=561572 RepID=UPI001CB6A88B|nr:Golgi membrane protein 1-like isoform X5 [Frieseomelitta varia]
MGIDSMRVGGGRCPPLLVAGLLAACLMLICNWWTLSSENFELLRQFDELNEQLKISAEERDQCVTLRGTLQQRYKHAEDEVNSLHVRLEQQAELKKKNDELEDSINVCKSELESLNKLDATKTATLETLRLEKNTINTQLDAKRDENKRLQEEIEQLKDKIKLTCNPNPQKKTISLLQPQTSPKNQKNNDSNGELEDNPEFENSKAGNTETTDGNIVESGRDQHTNGGTIGD